MLCTQETGNEGLHMSTHAHTYTHAYTCTHTHVHMHTHAYNPYVHKRARARARTQAHARAYTQQKPRYTRVTKDWPEHSPGPRGGRIQHWEHLGDNLEHGGIQWLGGTSGGCSPLPAETEAPAPGDSYPLTTPSPATGARSRVGLSGQFCRCVALGKSLYLPELRFSHLKNGTNKRTDTCKLRKR